MKKYKYEIQKEFHFSASHQLLHLPEGHQCKRLHGHNYIVVIVLGADEVDENGFVVDYGELKPFKEMIDKLDHRHLNHHFDFYPTAENMAKHFYDEAKQIWNQTIEVKVSETPKTWSSYRGEE